MTKFQPKKAGEQNASSAVKFFNNIKNRHGDRLVQSEKRARLLELMQELSANPDINICMLSDGRSVPIIVVRQEPKRGAFCYFNTADAPADEIYEAFAQKVGAECVLTRPQPKKDGELIANDAKQLLDDVCINDKKLTGTEKLDYLLELFAKLYSLPQQNRIAVKNGKEVPMVVERLGVNNRRAYCLNTSEYRAEVLTGFARWAGCTYREDKENLPELPERQESEMTARMCARIFHNVPPFGEDTGRREASPRLIKWFDYIYKTSGLNEVKLPDGTVVPVVVPRQSCAQRCLCLNTSDEYAKPYVIKRLAEMTQAEICLDNLKIAGASTKILYKTIYHLMKMANNSVQPVDKDYYRSYAQKVYQVMSPKSREITVADWLAHHQASAEK